MWSPSPSAINRASSCPSRSEIPQSFRVSLSMLISVIVSVLPIIRPQHHAVLCHFPPRRVEHMFHADACSLSTGQKCSTERGSLDVGSRHIELTHEELPIYLVEEFFSLWGVLRECDLPQPQSLHCTGGHEIHDETQAAQKC